MPPPAPTVRLGNLIRIGRVDAGLSQRGLGELVGTNQSAVSAWEAGGVLPRLDVVLALARVLGVDPHALIDACEDDLDGQLPEATP